MKYESTEKEWNMAALFLARVNERCDEADVASINFEYMTWYRALRATYRIVYSKIETSIQFEKDKPKKNKNAKDQLDDLFKTAAACIFSAHGIKDNTSKQNLITDLEKQLDEIHMMLAKVLMENNLVFPKKDNSNIEEKMEEDFS